MIELEGVTKLYGTVIGINDVSVSLAPGAHGLLGPNGAGKTTFLNLITGQLKPTMGQVRVFGANPRNRSSVLRRLAVCPGDEAFYANVSGLDWVRYLLELHGFGAQEALDRAIAALERLGMAAAMNRTVGGYSRGMRQRTKIAQAIAQDPDLLILDEPFSGLDPVGRRLVTAVLHEWVDQGAGLLMASHILHEVEAVTPAFLLICGGRLLASGTAQEVNEVLAELPSEVRIDCDDPHGLANRLIQAELVTSIEFNGSGTLRLSTRCPLDLYNALPGWVRDGVRIHEVHSSSESLQALFDLLMNVHRGGQ